MKLAPHMLAAAACVCLGHSATARVVNFDDQMPASYTYDGSNPIVTGPSKPRDYTVPVGSTGNFFADYNGSNVHATSTATLELGDTYNTFSVLWGTVDSYNTLDFLDGTNVVFSVTGSQAAAEFGAKAGANQTITYSTSGFSFDGIRLITTNHNAFEIDNINVTSVPEPSTWATVGLGTLGASVVALRRRRAQV